MSNTSLASRSRLRRGYTLIEIMVVAAISLLLMTIVAFIYKSALKVYEETQGLSLVYETAKLINSDMRNYLGYVVPVPGNWIDPKTYNFPGHANATKNDVDAWYLDPGGAAGYTKVGAGGYMENNPPLTGANRSLIDMLFSNTQAPGTSNGVGRGNGYFRNGWPYGWWNFPNGDYNMTNWAGVVEYDCYRGYWMPAFYGHRQPTSVIPPDSTMVSTDVNAGSWGWPRPDYRMDIDIDNTSGGYRNKVPLVGGGATPVIACWFYAENRTFNSARTLALDNSNIVLVSMKFSYSPPNPIAVAPFKPTPEQTQLSVLRHSIVGFDLPNQGLLRSDETTGSMLRAIKITPYWFDQTTNKLVEMTDADLNSSLANGSEISPLGGGVGPVPPAPAAMRSTPGFKVPRAFDVEYVLRNPYTYTRYTFALRIYCQVDPLAIPN